MSQGMARRLSKINYQIKKSLVSEPTDGEKVEALRSIYDAAINPGNETEIASVTLPTEVFGVSIDWENNNTEFVLTKGTFSVNDDLIDEEEPDIENTENFLQVNGEMFLVNGEYLSVA